MLPKIVSRLGHIKQYVLHKGRYEYLQKRMHMDYAPYSFNVLANFLQDVKQKDNVRVHNFDRQNLSKESINLFIRIDVDTQRCIENAPKLFDTLLALDLPFSAFFRVDDEDYQLREYRDVISQYRDRPGVNLGLHTSCYVEDDFMEQFRLDTEKFIEEAGFAPSSFTVHGLGSFRKKQRNQFYAEIGNRLEEFGYTFTDCSPKYREYYYVIEDCHKNNNGDRFIYNDFNTIPTFLQAGHNCLILTHPCYWA